LIVSIASYPSCVKPGISSTPLQICNSGNYKAAMAMGLAAPQPISQKISPG